MLKSCGMLFLVIEKEDKEEKAHEGNWKWAHSKRDSRDSGEFLLLLFLVEFADLFMSGIVLGVFSCLFSFQV